GTYNNLVVFVRFKNQNEYTEPLGLYSQAFNGAGMVSMNEYFKEVSKNQLSITSSFYPAPNGTTIVSYQDAYMRRYYQPYNASTNPDGYRSDNEYINREMTLLKNAIESVRAQVEASGIDYDHDDDGKIDNVCFIVQGPTDGWSDLLWPHRWVLYAYDVRIGGARVYDFNFQLSEALGVSVLCHEMFHSLGAPDLYRYQNTDITPVGPWDLMAHNSTPPQHMGAYMKMKYGRWFQQIPEITADGTYTLKPLATEPFAAYRIPSPNSTQEYFVLEYRKAAGRFESSLAGSGLIIYRVNPALDGNAQGPPDEVYVYRLNGSTRNNGTINSATFSSNVGRTEFNDNTNPSCFLSSGAPGGIRISNITASGETISFRVGSGASLEPPGNLTASLSGTSAILSWDAPVAGGATLTGYKVYRNQAAVASLNANTRTFTDQGLVQGIYQYHVTATYTTPTGESVPSNVVSVTIGGEPKPDLLLSSAGVDPSNVEPGQTVELSCRVVNQGDAGAGATMLRIYLSRDQAFDSGDRQLSATTVSALLPQAGQDIQLTALVSISQEIGNWFVLFLCDADGAVAESIETNNQASRPLTVGNPAFNPPRNLIAFTDLNTVTLNWDAPDQSAATLQGYRIFRNGTAIFQGNDPATGTYTDPGLQPGNYTYHLTALYSSPTGESPGSNPISVTVTHEAKPDLTIRDFTLTPSEVAAGGSIDIYCVLMNIGSLAAPGSEVRLYLSANEQLDAGDISLAYGRMDPLEPGSSINISGEYIQVPKTISPGNWYALIVADAAREVVESNEDNNISSFPFRILGNIPDLQITHVSLFPALITPLANVRITFNVYNNGAAPSSTFYTTFFLSTDEVLDASDPVVCTHTTRLLGSKTNVMLNAGFVMTTAFPVGPYYLIGKVDSGNMVNESDENNNLFVHIVNVAGTSSTGFDGYQEGLLVYPVPAIDQVHLIFSGTEGETTMIRIFDELGRMVTRRELTAGATNHLEEDIRGWRPGIYLVRLEQETGTRTARFLVK
ncbi:MAG: CARDB domain-containing protein, partial [Bacteroidales bacterium]